ncbi:MAG: amylo-alpha-1,6-glucosidase [Chloroflexota bacterium]
MTYLDLLKDHIDITRVPFSDRGSRLLVFKHINKSRLYVKLAERLTSIEPDIEAYLRRPAFITDICLIDDQGSVLNFELTVTPYRLTFHTRIGDFALVFQDRRTLSWRVPPGVTGGLRFHVSPQYWRQTDAGGTFKAVRNVAYHTNGEVRRNKITPRQGGYTVELIIRDEEGGTIAVKIYPEHGQLNEFRPFSQSSEEAEQRWREWFSRVPPVAERYQKMYAHAWWVMANNLISPQGNVAFESMSPSKSSYVGLWLWDNAMHALAFRHVDPRLARDQIRGMLMHQFPSGMLPDAIYDEGIVSTIDHPIVGDVTKPPILAWAALKLHETNPDIEFLREIYEPLVRVNGWWLHMNDDDGDGLAQYNHPYSSGLDDSPLWDQGMPVESPDLNTYLCVQMGSLAMIAEFLGMPNDVLMWRKRAAAIVNRMIADFWDEDAGLFWTLHDEKPVRVVTPFNLFPLWTGQLPEGIRSRLLAHLTDPKEFWGEYVIPTVARNDPHYDPQTMWRGPAWANINYFFVEALQQIGEQELAATLCRKTLEMIMRHDMIAEYYNSKTGVIPKKAALAFGWTAAVFIDLAIRDTNNTNVTPGWERRGEP